MYSLGTHAFIKSSHRHIIHSAHYKSKNPTLFSIHSCIDGCLSAGYLIVIFLCSRSLHSIIMCNTILNNEHTALHCLLYCMMHTCLVCSMVSAPRCWRCCRSPSYWSRRERQQWNSVSQSLSSLSQWLVH